MAKKVQILLEDDLDGTTAAETVTFALDGTTYEIDLNERNASRLRSGLEKYVTAGRRTGGKRTPAPATKSASVTALGSSRNKRIREWAVANGHKVPMRGRIPASVVEAYEAAN